MGQKLEKDSARQLVSDPGGGSWGSWGWRIPFQSDFTLFLYLHLFIDPYRQDEISNQRTDYLLYEQ